MSQDKSIRIGLLTSLNKDEVHVEKTCNEENTYEVKKLWIEACV
jgi:hypothetical protein